MPQWRNLVFCVFLCAVCRAAGFGIMPPIKSVLLDNNPLGAKCLDGRLVLSFHGPGGFVGWLIAWEGNSCSLAALP